MDLALEDYQKLIVQTFRRVFAQCAAVTAEHDAEVRTATSALWGTFAELDGPFVGSSGPDGGTDGSLIDAVLVALEAGRGVATLPISEVLTARRLVSRSRARLPDQRGDAVAVYVPASTGLRWRADGRLCGCTGPRRGVAGSEFIVTPVDGVIAVLGSAQRGVSVQPQPSLGQMSLATVELHSARPLMTLEPGFSTLIQASADLRVLHAAELVGAADGALSSAVEYTKQRRQFGRSIASFQAVQHRLVDCRTALDAAELLVMRAASYQDSPPQNVYFSAVALLQAIAAAEQSATESLQFHGGYGYTLEHDSHRYLRFVKELGVLARDRQLIRDALPERACRLGGTSWISR